MNTKITKQELQKNLNQDRKISKTGYRALLLLTSLIKRSMSKDEIIECFEKDSVVGESLSSDSITNTVNMLRSVGCEIKRPSNKTDYRYVLVSHPFSSFLTKENAEAFQLIRESVSSLGDWELLINLNNFYGKISKYACDDKVRESLIYNHKLKNLNLDILKELLNSIASKKQINITYNSAQKGLEDFEFFPDNITLENDKLYLWGYSFKYENYGYLKIDRIKNINFVRIKNTDESKTVSEKEVIDVVFKLKGLSAMMYIENEDEIAVENDEGDEYSLMVQAKVSNKFNFYQKLLSYGADCKIISPNSVVEEFKAELARIKSVYKNAI